jgi:four helix bundle protein
VNYHFPKGAADSGLSLQDRRSRVAAHAQSGKDFINKLEIAQKELNETAYWLQLLLATNLISKDQYHPIYNLNHEVKRMTRSSILTKKKNLGLL